VALDETGCGEFERAQRGPVLPFAAAGVHGWLPERGRGGSRQAHALLGALVAATAGFVPLP